MKMQSSKKVSAVKKSDLVVKSDIKAGPQIVVIRQN
jgi:hypothetical protein